ncbi:MAG: hypothetical protein D8M58_10090 [Calditrichaeota bacterium]|nr:MAG: hypothetical protein DWQ03_09465 [Calditrichota bacterium]MBL1205738.1 hypothetical protein [Calditrichota bacterium]NOG45566.1 hypothetical protein [Calditrichota bacterium]
MKKLISENTIEELYNSGKMRLEVDMADTIVTPQAQNSAQKLGVELVEIKTKSKVSYADKQKIINEVQKHFSGGRFSKSKIENAIHNVLAGLNDLS